MKRWKPFICVVTAAALSISTAAFGSQVTITPLDETHASSQGESNGALVTSQGPASNQGGVSQEGPSGDSGTTTVIYGGGESAAETAAAGSGPSADSSQSSDAAAASGTSQSSGTAADSGLSAAASQIAQPTVASEGAVLLNAADGTVLFSKNGDTQFYPASITKLMTALLVAENCSLDDTVVFSATATTNLESGAVAINMTEGDTMTVRQCLYALLLKSANEVGNALAEHVAGSNAAFADMMNAKAAIPMDSMIPIM